jgi:hypothetical protein
MVFLEERDPAPYAVPTARAPSSTAVVPTTRMRRERHQARSTVVASGVDGVVT